MKAKDLMNHPAVTCHVNDALGMPAHLMWEHDCGAIAVVNDEGKLTSMITDRDICMAAFTQGRALDDILVNSAMAKCVVSAGPDATVEELEKLMAEHQLRRIPIIDEQRRPIGMVSVADLVLEAARPGSYIPQAHLAHTLATIDRPRRDDEQHAA